MAPASETSLQRARRQLGARLDATWPNTRTSPRPRGLQSGGSDCYRNSALQVLAHLPKFVNWIMDHREAGQNWPCNPDDYNRHLLPHEEEDFKRMTQRDPRLLRACVACRLKEFFRDYWQDNTTSASTGNPTPFRAHRRSIEPLHSLGERWGCLPPTASKGERESQDDYTRRRYAEETQEAREARFITARGQNCGDEFLNGLLQGVLLSIHPDNQERLDDFNALFHLECLGEIRCLDCNEKPGEGHVQLQDSFGFGYVVPLHSDSDDVASAITRSALGTQILEGLDCERTGRKETGIQTWSIRAAPHYLRVSLSLFGGPTKNKRPIEIPPILDLTHNARGVNTDSPAWPLQYRLISVLSHIGGTEKSGHWCAGVSRPPSQKLKRKRRDRNEATAYYHCDDGRIYDIPADGDYNPLTENPREGSNAVSLMYERITTPRPKYLSSLETSLNHAYYRVGSGMPKLENGGKRNEEERRKKSGEGETEGKGNAQETPEKNGDQKATEKDDGQEISENDGQKASEKTPEKDGNDAGAEEVETVLRRSKRRKVTKSYRGMC